MPRTFKRLLVISDLHCGHRLGLTPPAWDPDKPQPRDFPFWSLRRYIWDWLETETKNLRPDVLLVNGDAIDGRGQASGGTELITIDRLEQCEIATAAIQKLVPKSTKVFMSYGTGYHTGKNQDLENIIAARVEAEKIGSEDNIEINGLVINYRHHIGRSAIPHGRFTALAREKLWNTLWAERDEYPKAHVGIRSHVHYHVYCGGPGWLWMITPGLQAYGSKYGSRRVTGAIDIGYVVFDIYDRDNFKWRAPILRLPKQEPISV